jgi:hypothetical protein
MAFDWFSNQYTLYGFQIATYPPFHPQAFFERLPIKSSPASFPLP